MGSTTLKQTRKTSFKSKKIDFGGAIGNRAPNVRCDDLSSAAAAKKGKIKVNEREGK